MSPPLAPGGPPEGGARGPGPHGLAGGGRPPPDLAPGGAPPAWALESGTLRRWPRTIGARLGAFNAVVVLAALLGVGGAGLVAVDRVLVASVERVIHDEATDVTLELLRVTESPAVVAALLKRESDEEHSFDLHFRLSRPDGGVVATSDPGFWEALPLRPAAGPRLEFRTLPGEPFRTRVGARRLETPAGPRELEVAIVLEDEDRAMATLLRGGALSVPVVVALAAAIGAWLARRALAPVAAIERAARSIGGGPRGQRLPSTGTGDELDRLGETLNAMLARLEGTALRTLAFVGDVAHEVRTPLAVVRARVEEAQALAHRPVESGGQAPGGAPEQAAHGPLEQALEGIESLERLLRGLLVLARAEEGTTGAEALPFDLARVAREVVSFFGPAAAARGIELRLAAPAPAPTRGDRTAVARALANLVDNAIAYAPAGLPVEVGVEAGPTRVRAVVRDGGPAIDPGLRPRLFDRFVRGPEGLRCRPEGAGLGLPLVRAIARAAGGDADLEAPPDGGNAFVLWLPRVDEGRQGQAPEAHPAAGA